MRRLVGVNSEMVRTIARRLKESGCEKAPAIGDGIANELADKARGGDKEAWISLVGLAAVGAAIYGRHILKENEITVKRRGQVVTIAGGYAIPDVITANNGAPHQADEEEEGAKPDGNVYVQFDFMTWSAFFTILELLRRRMGALHAVVITFEEIARFHELHPNVTVGEAMTAEGFDLTSRHIDLDILKKVV